MVILPRGPRACVHVLFRADFEDLGLLDQTPRAQTLRERANARKQNPIQNAFVSNDAASHKGDFVDTFRGNQLST